MNLRSFLTSYCTVLALLFLGCIAESQAQGGLSQNRSSRGRDFYMTFMPNVHDGRQGGITDSLYIYITSEVPTSGVIRYRNRNRQLVADNFTITNPNQIVVYRIYYLNVELQGYFSGNGTPINFNNSQSERVAPQYVRVTANQDVTVYGLNQGFFTSDAFLALPVPSLGREYVVMSYKSDARGQNFTTSERDETSTPSQFAIVATQDATDVIVRPSDPVLFGGTVRELRVRLNEGESYLVQADPRTRDGLADLTGSRVIATKPVAVFGGHQRATLPIEFKLMPLTSRDCLIEQMPGIETWGRRAFLTPLQRSSSEVEAASNLYRVLAAYDTTRVFLNGQPLATLNAGQYFEAPLTASGIITASDLILVAQFKKTSGAGNLIGDPFMLLIPTVEQYDRSYRFINVQVSDRDVRVAPNGQVYTEHFLTIVAPTNSLGSLRLDEQPVATGNFQAIGNSGFSFANISVSGGVHTARGDSAFAIYVYGYGIMNSYGYIGGGRLRIIAPDRDVPALVARDTCFGVSGTVFDTLLTDSRIASVQALTPRNVTVNIDRFTPFADSVRFRATVQNIFADGEFTLEARDSAGFVARRRFLLPGITVGLEGQGASNTGQNLRFTMARGTSRIFRFPIVNYGATTQTINALTLINDTGNPVPMRLIAPQIPLRLPPQGLDTIVVTLDASQNGVYRASLGLGTLCGARSLAAIVIEAGQDTTAPVVTTERDVCARRVRLLAQDGEPFPSGLARIEILEQPINCTIAISPPNTVPSGIQSGTTPREILITILNPRRDAIYALRLTDSVGKSIEIRDTVQGFTLEIVRPNTTSGSVGAWGSIPITERNCRNIEVRNVGIKPYRLERITPRTNIWFSAASSQFPIEIPAGASRLLNLCFAPLEVRDYVDTLLVEGFCEREVLVLTGRGEPLIRVDTGRCNVVIQIRTERAPLSYFMEQNFPNPTSGGFTSIRAGLPESGLAVLRLFTPIGNEVARVNLGVLPQGEHDILVDVANLQSGTYFYVLETPITRLTKQMMILH